MHNDSLLSVSVGSFKIFRLSWYDWYGRIIFRARFWICSIWSLSEFGREECHTGHAYSRTGRIKLQKTLRRSLDCTPLRLRSNYSTFILHGYYSTFRIFTEYWAAKLIFTEPGTSVVNMRIEYCRFWRVNCIFWPIETLNWQFRHYSGQ